MSSKKRDEKPRGTETNQVKNEDVTSPAILEVVLKADEAGTLEAAADSLLRISVPGVQLQIIHKAVGPVIQSDLLMAQTGSRLIIGYNSGVAPSLKKQAASSGVEIRLYDVIYELIKNVENICSHLTTRKVTETILGSAKIIATFKAAKGMIIGCQVTEGRIVRGKNLRVITAMGPAYTGKVASLQIEKKSVNEGKKGEQIGIHLPDWQKAKVGDWVECLESLHSKNDIWKPNPGIHIF